MYIPPPDLAGALRRGRTAGAQIPGLEQDFAQAQADANVFREQPLQTAGSGGWASFLQPVAETVRASKGRAAERDVRPRLDAARNAVAEEQAEAAVLKNALEQRASDQNYESSVLRNTLAKNKDARDEARMNRIESGQGTYVSPDGKQEVTTFKDKNGVLRIQGTGEELPVGWVEKERAYSGFGRGKALTAGQKNELMARNQALKNAGDVLARFRESGGAFAKPTGFDTAALNKAGGILADNDLLQYVPLVGDSFDKEAKKAYNWWSDWRMLVTLPKRNKLFGATLTPGERQAWAEAERIEMGADPAAIEERMVAMYQAVERAQREGMSALRQTSVTQDIDLLDTLAGQAGGSWDAERNTYSYGDMTTNYKDRNKPQAAYDALVSEEEKLKAMLESMPNE